MLDACFRRHDRGGYGSAFPRRDQRPSYRGETLRNERAQGRPGTGWHPWPPCEEECTGQEPQAQPRIPGLPCAVALRLTPRSPRGSGLLAPVVHVMRSIIADLTPASRCQDHAYLAVRKRSFVRTPEEALRSLAATAPRLPVH